MSANIVPSANLGMVRAGIAALEKSRLDGSASKDNGDANAVYAVYEAMRAEFLAQSIITASEEN